MIRIENLVKIYKAKGKRKSQALKGISITLPDTGMVFVTGKSGSGKSTLLNLIGGLDDITSGDIIVGGNSLSKFSLKDFSNYRSTYIGFIFQDYHILDEFTVKENIELSADIRDIDCDVEKCLEFVGLKGYEDRYPTELSGGQQQRVAIARALTKDSKIILADEPTGNLDTQTTKQILDLLKELSKDRLVLIVSHNLDDAEKYADRIIALDHGLLVSDRSRRDGYVNNLYVEDDKLYIPHHKDLSDEELKFILQEKDKYQSIIQNDDGMVETELISANEEKKKLEKSTLSFSKFRKIFNLIFKRRTLNKILTIFLASVLISLFYIFQSFEAFDENAQMVDYNVNELDSDVVIKKNYDDYKGEIYPDMYLCNVTDKDINKFKDYGFKGNIYKLYNTTVQIGGISTHSASSIRNFLYNPSSLYLSESLGTLNCTEEYLVKLFGVDGKLDYVGDLYATEHGVIITDYIADAMLLYYKKTSYQELLGVFPAETYYYTHINAVVKTNYKQKYSEIFDEYAKLFDDDPYNDNVYDTIISSDQYFEFALDVDKFLGISYNLSENFEEAILNVEVNNYNGASYVTFTSDVASETYTSPYFRYNDSLDLKDNEAYMSTSLYNELFNTNYDENTTIEGSEVEVQFRVRGKASYTKKFIIKSLVKSSTRFIYMSKDYYEEFLEYKNIAYSLYFDGYDGIDKIKTHIGDLGYYVLTTDTAAITYVYKLHEVFGKFLNIIAYCLLLACIVYLMNFGYRSIINNYYEIGILSALGCKNKDIGKLFLLEILTVGIGILGISLIGMNVGIYLANLVLIESFGIVFKVSFTNIDVVIFTWEYVVLDMMIAILVISISALFPMYYIRKVKPVKILKAKE